MIDIKVKCRNCGTFTRIEDDDLKRIYEKGRAEAFEELFNELHVKEFIVDFTIDQCRREGNRYYLNATTDFNIVLEYLFSMYLEQLKGQKNE